MRTISSRRRPPAAATGWSRTWSRRSAPTLHAVSTAAAVSDLFDDALRRRIGLSVGTGGVRLDLGSRPSRGDLDALSRSLAALMVRTAQVAAERGRLLLITVDEAQNADADALAVLCHTLADVQNQHERTTGPRGEAVRAYLPLAVYLAGLPSLPERIRTSGSTFFERALTFDFGLLRGTRRRRRDPGHARQRRGGHRTGRPRPSRRPGRRLPLLPPPVRQARLGGRRR
jgi:hypothetical protein